MSQNSLNEKEKIFKQMFETYYAPFCLYAKRFIEDRDTREDIISDIFAHIWEHFEMFNLESESVLSYIKVSIRNRCLNLIRHQDYKIKYIESIQENPPLYETTPDSIYSQEELYKLLKEALDTLPQIQRQVFIESVFKEKNNIEIAQKLDISTKTVIRHKQKAIEHMRKELKEYMPLLLLLFLLNYK